MDGVNGWIRHNEKRFGGMLDGGMIRWQNKMYLPVSVSLVRSLSLSRFVFVTCSCCLVRSDWCLLSLASSDADFVDSKPLAQLLLLLFVLDNCSVCRVLCVCYRQHLVGTTFVGSFRWLHRWLVSSRAFGTAFSLCSLLSHSMTTCCFDVTTMVVRFIW